MPDWPKEYGGGGLDAAEHKVLREEMAAMGARSPLSSFGIWMLGPALLKYGTEAQKKEHLPKIAAGLIRWCQGYSEPNAGSDLASLQTRAESDGDDYIINGQKIWTSYANYADWIFCLVRTDPTAKKHDGISFILFDMASKGVSTKPILLISGYSPFCETFFDNVRVPKSHVVGTVNRGWDVAKYLLQHERAMISGMGERGVGRPLGQVAADSVGADAQGRLEDADAAQPDLDLRDRRGGAVRRQPNARSIWRKPGQSHPAFSSAMKYYGTELNKRRHEILMSAGGADALEWESERSRGGARPRAWLRTKANSIEGGTSRGDARHRRQAHPRSAGGLEEAPASCRGPVNHGCRSDRTRSLEIRDRAHRMRSLTIAGTTKSIDDLFVTGIHQWPSSSPKNNPCCATARAALSATRRRCRICVSLRDSKDATGFSRDLWKAFAEMGFSGLLVPENFGGSGLGCVEAGVVMEEIGRTLMPSPFLSTAVLAASALSRGGSEAQKSAHLPKIADGSLLAALAIDEGAKHRPLQTKLQAVRSGNGFKLNGAKAFVVDGHTADLLIVAGQHRRRGRRAQRADAVPGRPQGQRHRHRAHGDGRRAQRRADRIQQMSRSMPIMCSARSIRAGRCWKACSTSAAARWLPKWWA